VAKLRSSSEVLKVCTVQYCTILYSIVLYCTVYGTVLCSRVQYCTAQNITVLHCTVLKVCTVGDGVVGFDC